MTTCRSIFIREQAISRSSNPEIPLHLQTLTYVAIAQKLPRNTDTPTLSKSWLTVITQAQANRPFEHDARLKELLQRQEQINALLDLDKGERQVAEAARDRDELTMPNQTPEISAPGSENSSLAVPRNGSHRSRKTAGLTSPGRRGSTCGIANGDSRHACHRTSAPRHRHSERNRSRDEGDPPGGRYCP